MLISWVQKTYTKLNLSYEKYDFLLMLRAFVCLFVISHHVLAHLNPVYDFKIWNGMDISWLFLHDGPSSLYILFTLSGYLLAKGFFTGRFNWSVQGLKNFYIDRFVRILPLFYFIITIIFFLSLSDLYVPLNFVHYLKQLVFIDDLNRFDSKFLGHAWTVPAELSIYLVMPLMIYFLWKVSKYTQRTEYNFFFQILSLLLIFFVYTFGEILNVLFTNHWYNPLIKVFSAFLVGVFTYYLVIVYPQFTQKLNQFKILSPLLVLIWLGISMTYFFWVNPILGASINAFFALFTCLLTGLLIILNDSPTSNAHEYKCYHLDIKSSLGNFWKFLEMVGFLSYGVYLWQCVYLYFAFFLFEQYFSGLAGYIIKFTFTASLCIVSAIGSYYWIEKPANDWKYRLIK